MLIASRFKRPHAPVTLGDETYFFKPIDPANPDSEHVAEVENEDHIGRLLSITEGYYIAKGAPVAVPIAARPAAQAVAVQAAPVTQAQQADASANAEEKSDSEPANSLTEEQAEAAQKLNALGVRQLRDALEQGAERAVIEEALRIELAKDENDQRASTIKLLQSKLDD